METPKPAEMSEAVKVAEAAAELGVKRAAIYRAIDRHRLRFMWRGGVQMTERRELEAYRARTRPDGTKPSGRPCGSKNRRPIGP